jgi:hypothetical protein
MLSALCYHTALLDLNQLESILSKIPTSILNPKREEPPELINGSGIPMTGMIPIVIPILTKKWVNITPTTPKA